MDFDLPTNPFIYSFIVINFIIYYWIVHGAQTMSVLFLVWCIAYYSIVPKVRNRPE